METKFKLKHPNSTRVYYTRVYFEIRGGKFKFSSLHHSNIIGLRSIQVRLLIHVVIDDTM